MGRFPIVRTEKTVPGRAPVVRADIDVRTGEEAVGQAIGQAVIAGVGLGIDYDITQAQTQLSEFQRKANEEINRLALSFDTNLDPETYQAEYQKSVETIHALMPKNERAAKNARLWLNTKEPAWLKDVDKARLNRADDNWMAELFMKQAAVSQTGQIGTFPAFVTEGVKAGRIDKSDAVRMMAATRKIAAMANRMIITNAIHETARAMPYTEAITYINDFKGITRTERNDLIARRKRQNEIETATTNPKVRWDTLRKVTEDPKSITDEYLEGLVKPNSLTWQDAEEFKKIRDSETDPLQTGRAKLYFKMLDILYGDKDTETDVAYEWDIANEKLRAFFKNNPNATAKQTSEAYQEITADKKSDLLKRLWEGFVIGTGGRGFWPERPKKRPETLRYTAINPDTGERMGSNDGVKWSPIP